MKEETKNKSLTVSKESLVVIQYPSVMHELTVREAYMQVSEEVAKMKEPKRLKLRMKSCCEH